METFGRLFIVAALAGLVSGIFITLVHQVSTTPLILAAEVYEGPADAVATDTHDDAAGATGHSHSEGDAEA